MYTPLLRPTIFLHFKSFRREYNLDLLLLYEHLLQLRLNCAEHCELESGEQRHSYKNVTIAKALTYMCKEDQEGKVLVHKGMWHLSRNYGVPLIRE